MSLLLDISSLWQCIRTSICNHRSDGKSTCTWNFCLKMLSPSHCCLYVLRTSILLSIRKKIMSSKEGKLFNFNHHYSWIRANLCYPVHIHYRIKRICEMQIMIQNFSEFPFIAKKNYSLLMVYFCFIRTIVNPEEYRMWCLFETMAVLPTSSNSQIPSVQNIRVLCSFSEAWN